MAKLFYNFKCKKIVINMYNNESAIIVLWGLNYHKKRLMYTHGFLLGKVCVINANDYCIGGNIYIFLHSCNTLIAAGQLKFH